MLFSRIITTILAALGGILLLSEMLINLEWPSWWNTLGEKSRSICLSATAVVVGSIIAIANHVIKNAKQRRHVLYLDLEVKLTQLEGIVNTALVISSRKDTGLNSGLSFINNIFTKYMPKYLKAIDLVLKRAKRRKDPTLEEIQKFIEEISKDILDIVWEADEIISLKSLKLSSILNKISEIKSIVVRRRNENM